MFYGFMSTGLGFDQRACMVYRNKAIPSTCVCPRTGIKNYVRGFAIKATENMFFIFLSAKTSFVVKQV
jgi:hypothetical protein